ncbi:hypothetical protein [Rahnella woolbedingensis]|uniref:hypothetical protein n=1 Tax=Rahnella woolbedingensis TaxID=1510574 RepID=UPI00142D60DE|nr:hypothetical protein [Rahnella woolbedingensis]
MPGEQTQEPVTGRTDYHFVQVLYAGEAIFFAILANKPAHAKDIFVTLVTFFLESTYNQLHCNNNVTKQFATILHNASSFALVLSIIQISDYYETKGFHVWL